MRGLHTFVVLELTHIVVKRRHCYVKCFHHVKLHLSVFRDLWKLILDKKKNSKGQEKESIIPVRVG